MWALSGGRFPLALGVLQILALDIGTDLLPALALGAEPPARHVLDGPPVSGRLLNGTVLRRAFGLLGPLEAGLSMVAFLVSLLLVGWSPGGSFRPATSCWRLRRGFHHRRLRPGRECLRLPHHDALAGRAAWLSIVSFPGRSEQGSRSPSATLRVPPVADLLGQASPPPAGWAVALIAIPTLLAVDALGEHLRRRRVARQGTSAASTPTA